MREIKFKGKRLDNGEWMYGDLLHLVDGVYISNVTETTWRRYTPIRSGSTQD